MKKMLLLLILSFPLFAQYGNELVYNGLFNSDVSGWINNSYDTFEWSSGTAHAVHNGVGSWKNFGVADVLTPPDRRFNIVTGKTYRFNFKHIHNSGNLTIWAFWRSSNNGSQVKSWGAFTAGYKTQEWLSTATSTISISFDINFACDFAIDSVSVRQKLDTLYISNAGNDNNLGDSGNPIKTIAEALARGFYDGGVFAFRSGDTFAETFTAGNNTTLAVYSGSNAVTISTIDANGYTVTQSPLINPATTRRGFGGYAKGSTWLGW